MKNRLKLLFLLIMVIFNIVLIVIAEEEANSNTELVNNKTTILEMHRQKIVDLIQACQEKGIYIEECKKSLEQRLSNYENLSENSRDKLAEFEIRKVKKNQEIKTLEQNNLFAKPKLNLDFKARAVEKVRIEKARKDFIITTFGIKESKVRLKNARSKLNAAKGLEKICKNLDFEKCKAAKAKLFIAAKEHFLAQADYIIKALEKIKSGLQGNEDLTDEEELKITAALDTNIKIVMDIEAKIKIAENKEQLLKAAEELKNSWDRIWSVAQKDAAFVVSSRIASIIVQSKYLEEKLEGVLIKMTENGQDTSKVQVIIDKFYIEIEAVKKSFETSQTLWLGVKVDSKANAETNTIIQQVQYELKDSRDHLKKSRLLLAQIVSNVDRDLLEMADEELEAEIETSGISTSTSNTSETSDNKSYKSTSALTETSVNISV